jgi:hypothetical protein
MLTRMERTWSGRIRSAASLVSVRAIVSLERRAVSIAVLLSIGTFVVAMAAATRCACGSDPYGYVSEADLWASGALHVPQPLALALPWPAAEWTLSPLGYRPATFPGAIVPTYPPGLPMAMALALKITGMRSAVFLVVPILGAAAVWGTFLLGRRLDTAVVGLSGALLLACSPTFLFQVIQPMSDVPATAWWTAAAVLAFRATATSAFLCGVACSAAVLTRPNLAPLVILFVPFIRDAHRFIRRTLWFLVGALPGPLSVAWIQNSLYGSPLASGYGRFADIYSVSNVAENVRLYPGWLWETHGPFIFVGLLSPLVWAIARNAAFPGAGRLVWFSLAFTLLVFSFYIVYSPFDNWTYTRFLLPAFPHALLLAVWTLFVLGRWFGSPAMQAAVLATVLLVAWTWIGEVTGRRVLATGRGESRYIAAAQYIRATTTPEILVLAMQHSGSLRYYAERTTVRYDWLDGRGLDDAIRAMRAMNRTPLIVLDDWEETKFRERFRGQRWGALDWPHRAEFQSQPRVRVYDPFDRDRFFANEPIPTARFPVR